jgi:hypothetical protein
LENTDTPKILFVRENDVELNIRYPDSITLTIYPTIKQLINSSKGALEPSQVTFTALKLIFKFERNLNVYMKGYMRYDRYDKPSHWDMLLIVT